MITSAKSIISSRFLRRPLLFGIDAKELIQPAKSGYACYEKDYTEDIKDYPQYAIFQDHPAQDEKKDADDYTDQPVSTAFIGFHLLLLDLRVYFLSSIFPTATRVNLLGSKYFLAALAISEVFTFLTKSG